METGSTTYISIFNQCCFLPLTDLINDVIKATRLLKMALSQSVPLMVRLSQSCFIPLLIKSRGKIKSMHSTTVQSICVIGTAHLVQNHHGLTLWEPWVAFSYHNIWQKGLLIAYEYGCIYIGGKKGFISHTFWGVWCQLYGRFQEKAIFGGEKGKIKVY